MKKQKMNCQNARNISVIKVLEKFGHFPKRESEKEAWFLSPFRSEIEASFKVSKILNAWYDHGEGIGGNVIDLIIKLKKCSTSEALKILSNNINPFSFHQQPQNILKQEKNYKIIEVKSLQHKALIDYLNSRKIDVSIAKKYCQEIYYELGSKKYFTIAFENDEKGYEIRNKYFKGNLLNKNIRTINNGAKSACVFEGFMDFLSFEVIFKSKGFEMDYIILNSISNVNSIIDRIKKYDKVFCFLDNDEPGKKATSILSKNHKCCLDYSFIYNGFNDLNHYLIEDKINT